VELPTDPFGGLDVKPSSSSSRAAAVAVAAPKRSGAEEIAFDLAPPPASAARPVSGGGYVELDGADDEAASSGLQTVSVLPTAPSGQRPALVARAAPSPRAGVPSAGAFETADVVRAIVLGVVVLGLGGLLIWQNPLPGGWSVVRWLGGADRATTLGVAGASVVAAAVTGAAGVRAPMSWGHVVAAVGLFAVGALLGGGAFAEGLASLAPQVMPIASSLVPLGAGVWAVTKAFSQLREDAAARKAAGFVLAAVAAAGFSAAIQLLRG
jgi:hypothetical protein